MGEYANNGCLEGISGAIIAYLKEGCGIRSISRLLNISTNTVLARIKMIAGKIKKPMVSISREYEMDELKTYIKNKNNEYWVIYALDRDSGQVSDFKVGKRTKKNIKKVTDTLILSECKQIHTDGLGLYKYIIPTGLHNRRRYGTNKIERKNLSLRTHLKRLSRKTICYSKSPVMLEACLIIYFWYNKHLHSPLPILASA
jgi:insertion element IS1 protein InsB